MSDIVIISGSPFPDSRTDIVLKYIEDLVTARGFTIKYFTVSDIPAEDLVRCNFDSPDIKEIQDAILDAKGIVVGSPVYKASYTGVFKALIDLLPQDVFAYKIVLPIMTGGTKAHLLALEYTLKPLLATLKAHHLKGIYLVENEITKGESEPINEEEVHTRLQKQLNYFLELTKKLTIDL